MCAVIKLKSSLTSSFFLLAFVLFGFFKAGSFATTLDWQAQGSLITAKGCFFTGNDISKIHHTSSEQCGKTCVNTLLCTHFTWIAYDKGTCWIKIGKVTREQAYKSSHSSTVCGLTVGREPL